ncbi:MAG: UDP-N-acetylglucosamine pyrophosphorylase [Clostridia bacterium]|nr:UDP-N-acetylglucosamine pyrophosphorylase [Clostridia bacterium]
MILPKMTDLFDLSHTLASELIRNADAPYEVLPKIKDFIRELSVKLRADEYYEICDGVFVAKDAKISDKATIIGPTIIGHGAEIRPGAYIRGSVLIGNGAVIGNSTEIKNAIIFDEVQLPHYNYVGDSILGYKAHLGAGAIISNFKLDHGNVKVRSGSDSIETGLRKFGALMGDFVEVGCNSVVLPGSIVGKRTLVYPLTSVRGIIPADIILHNDGTLTSRK